MVHAVSLTRSPLACHYSRGVDKFFKVGGASCPELLLMSLGGSGGMPPKEIFDFFVP